MKKPPSSEKIMQVYYTDPRKRCLLLSHCPANDSWGWLRRRKLREAAERERGREVWGVELSESAATVAESNLDRVLAGGFHENYPNLPKKYFDCLVFNDVLEHLQIPTGCWNCAWYPGSRWLHCMFPSQCTVHPHLYEVLIEKDWEYKAGVSIDRNPLPLLYPKSIIRMFTNHWIYCCKLYRINPTTMYWRGCLGSSVLAIWRCEVSWVCHRRQAGLIILLFNILQDVFMKI